MISLEEARDKAEELAGNCLGGLVSATPDRWLSASCLEESACWLFLRADNIEFLPQCRESGDMAFVVSKKGKTMTVADHHGDTAELKRYLKDISNYLEQRRE